MLRNFVFFSHTIFNDTFYHYAFFFLFNEEMFRYIWIVTHGMGRKRKRTKRNWRNRVTSNTQLSLREIDTFRGTQFSHKSHSTANQYMYLYINTNMPKYLCIHTYIYPYILTYIGLVCTYDRWCRKHMIYAVSGPPGFAFRSRKYSRFVLPPCVSYGRRLT